MSKKFKKTSAPLEDEESVESTSPPEETEEEEVAEITPSEVTESPPSEKEDNGKVTLRAKQNWRLKNQFVAAGETVEVDKPYADLLLKKTNNFSLV